MKMVKMVSRCVKCMAVTETTLDDFFARIANAHAKAQDANKDTIVILCNQCTFYGIELSGDR